MISSSTSESRRKAFCIICWPGAFLFPSLDVTLHLIMPADISQSIILKQLSSAAAAAAYILSAAKVLPSSHLAPVHVDTKVTHFNAHITFSLSFATQKRQLAT